MSDFACPADDLSEAEIDQVIAYFESVWDDRLPRVTPPNFVKLKSTAAETLGRRWDFDAGGFIPA